MALARCGAFAANFSENARKNAASAFGRPQALIG
jgi:hypothetical protein